MNLIISPIPTLSPFERQKGETGRHPENIRKIYNV